MKKAILSILAAAALAAGCFGGGDDKGDSPAPPTSGVPPSASQSVQGFIDYLVALTDTAPNDLEPVDVSAVTPPTSGTTEPAELRR